MRRSPIVAVGNLMTKTIMTVVSINETHPAESGAGTRCTISITPTSPWCPQAVTTSLGVC